MLKPKIAASQAGTILNKGIANGMAWTCPGKPNETACSGIKCERVKALAIGLTKLNSTTAISIAVAVDATAPSHVLPGLTRGASLCFPMARPTYKAEMSPHQTSNIVNKTYSEPYSGLRSGSNNTRVTPT